MNYDRSAIMHTAHRIRKATGKDFATALSDSWNLMKMDGQYVEKMEQVKTSPSEKVLLFKIKTVTGTTVWFECRSGSWKEEGFPKVGELLFKNTKFCKSYVR